MLNTIASNKSWIVEVEIYKLYFFQKISILSLIAYKFDVFERGFFTGQNFIVILSKGLIEH